MVIGRNVPCVVLTTCWYLCSDWLSNMATRVSNWRRYFWLPMGILHLFITM